MHSVTFRVARVFFDKNMDVTKKPQNGKENMPEAGQFTFRLCRMRDRLVKNYFQIQSFQTKARWQSGHAADCNSVNAGSIPTRASIFYAACRPINFWG